MEERQFTKEDMKNIRYILGMSQKEFALLIGVSQQLISFIEKGTYSVTKTTNNKIHSVVYRYIDKETLFKILDGEVEL